MSENDPVPPTPSTDETPPAPSIEEASLDEATGVESGLVALADGGRVAFEVRGREHGGTPALLVRPLAGSMALWGEFRDALARRLTVIAFDPRGVGRSSDAPLGLTTRAMARDAVGLLDALRVERAHVFGISLGAMVATWLAADAPSRVGRLCLACAGPTGLELPPPGALRAAEVASAVLAPDDEMVARIAESILSRHVRERRPDRVEAVEAAAEGEPARRAELLKHALAAALHDARGELGLIAAPTLVLAGERDELLGTAPPEALAAAIAGARFEVVAGAGHDLTLEQPAETARRVGDFFLNG